MISKIVFLPKPGMPSMSSFFRAFIWATVVIPAFKSAFFARLEIVILSKSLSCATSSSPLASKSCRVSAISLSPQDLDTDKAATIENMITDLTDELNHFCSNNNYPYKVKDILIGDTELDQVYYEALAEKVLTALDEPKLSSLLYHVAGIREKNEFMQANRFYPSAGARYPLEVYPLVFNVKGIKSGIYHYYVKNHLLEYLLQLRAP
jgi:hypothetical protein